MSEHETDETPCTYCPTGSMRPGTTTMTLERPGVTLVVKDVPAKVCWACGEAHLREEVVDRLEDMLDAAEEAGAETLVRHYEPTKTAA